MGALHIKGLLKVVDLKKILNSNNFSLIGTSCIVNVSHIKRASYCISLCALYCKLKEAQQNDRPDLTPMEWLRDKSSGSEVCLFW